MKPSKLSCCWSPSRTIVTAIKNLNGMCSMEIRILSV
jgi:hypothetical protein